MEPPVRRIRWRECYRLVSGRYPPIDLFERVADPADWESLIALEMWTNPRVRDQVGEISLVSPEERVSGPGASWLMAPFTHTGFPSRFSDGTFGVYYAAQQLETAVREKAHHVGQFLASTQEPLGTFVELRTLVSATDTRFHDLREGFKKEHAPASYVASQALAKTLRDAGSYGIVYRSVRHAGGVCLAAFRPKAVSIPVSGPHLRLRFDGVRIDRWFHFGQKLWRKL